MNREESWCRGGEADVYRRLAEMAAAGTPGVLATVVGSRRSTPRHLGAKMIVHADGRVTGTIGGGAAEARVITEAQAVLRGDRPRKLVLELTGDFSACGGSLEVFLEPIVRSQPFWIIGAGHVGRALIRLASALPLRLTVVDGREEFLTDIPGADVVCAGPAQVGRILTERAALTPRTALVVASHNHVLDGDYVAAILAAEREADCEVPYLGVIGSRTKAATLRARFAGDETLQARWQRVQMPVGLAIGAETPAEIALSVLAEALAVLRSAGLITAAGEPVGVYLHRAVPRGDAVHEGRPSTEAAVRPGTDAGTTETDP